MKQLITNAFDNPFFRGIKAQGGNGANKDLIISKAIESWKAYLGVHGYLIWANKKNLKSLAEEVFVITQFRNNKQELIFKALNRLIPQEAAVIEEDSSHFAGVAEVIGESSNDLNTSSNSLFGDGGANDDMDIFSFIIPSPAPPPPAPQSSSSSSSSPSNSYYISRIEQLETQLNHEREDMTILEQRVELFDLDNQKLRGDIAEINHSLRDLRDQKLRLQQDLATREKAFTDKMASREKELEQVFADKMATREKELEQVFTDKMASREKELEQVFADKMATREKELEQVFVDRMSIRETDMEKLLNDKLQEQDTAFQNCLAHHEKHFDQKIVSREKEIEDLIWLKMRATVESMGDIPNCNKRKRTDSEESQQMETNLNLLTLNRLALTSIISQESSKSFNSEIKALYDKYKHTPKFISKVRKSFEKVEKQKENELVGKQATIMKMYVDQITRED